MRGTRALVALLLGAALLTSACTVSDPATTVEAGAGSITPIDSLKGVTVTVGSKEFGEQLVLGNIALLAVRAAGADAKDSTNITGSDNVRRALTTGEIDLYWEYTGTAWVSYLKQTQQVNDPTALFDAVKQADAANGVTWWDPAPGNNTYAIAANKDVAARYGITTLSDYAALAQRDPAAAATCMGPEFKSRNDGFPGVEGAYGFTLPDPQQVAVSDAIVYTEVGSGAQCSFGSIATTDGRIKQQGLVVLQDDKKFFPVYNPAITVRTELAQAHPELEQVFAAISPKLTDDVLLSLNERVDVNAEPAATVAADWMRQEGFIG